MEGLGGAFLHHALSTKKKATVSSRPTLNEMTGQGCGSIFPRPHLEIWGTPEKITPELGGFDTMVPPICTHCRTAPEGHNREDKATVKSEPARLLVLGNLKKGVVNKNIKTIQVWKKARSQKQLF